MFIIKKDFWIEYQSWEAAYSSPAAGGHANLTNNLLQLGFNLASGLDREVYFGSGLAALSLIAHIFGLQMWEQ